MRRLAWFCMLSLPLLAQLLDRVQTETFLLNASIGNERVIGHAIRITLDDGKRKHEANLLTIDRNDQGDIYFNIAAYKLDQALELNLVVPAVERTVKGQPVVVQWWLDNVSMMELDRRKRNIQPPDPEAWNQQMQAVRLFDELISNPWRSMNPATASWQELLITSDWNVGLIDHRTAFRTDRRLENPETLSQCDRTLLAMLRRLSGDAQRQILGKYLSSEQLEALEARRRLLLKHFDELIAVKGERAVLYDLPLR